MEPVDLEKLIGELEIAVDRLRSLYEQYFVGLEKIVPAVLRKDVDRRFHVLRKEQIRNTALRFRFQMVLQRYNTYQTHWQRICREIENGTYKRHLIRAQRRFGSTRPPGTQAIPPLALDPPGLTAPGVPQDLAAQLVGLGPALASPSFDVDIEMEDESQVEGIPAPARAIPVSPQRAPSQVPKGAPPVWKKVPPPQAPAAPTAQASAVPPLKAPAAPTGPVAVVAPPLKAPAAPPRAPVAPPPVVERAPPPAHAVVTPPPPAAPLRPPPRPAPSIRPAPAAATGDLPDARLREIYAQYIGAKRSQNESTATITFQAVAKSLRESGDKLRKKHGKAVDFEVTVRDGKAILRPVLK